MKHSEHHHSGLQEMRIDQWLWAARFFKTRSIAKQAIEGGFVHCQGDRVKVSKLVKVGYELTIRQGHDKKTVVVNALSSVRGPAPVAQQLYTETNESIEKRAHYQEMRRLNNLARPDHRPTKKDRRQILHLQSSAWDEE